MRSSLHRVHLHRECNSFIAKSPYLHHSVLRTTSSFLSLALDSNILHKSCFLTSSPAPSAFMTRNWLCRVHFSQRTCISIDFWNMYKVGRREGQPRLDGSSRGSRDWCFCLGEPLCQGAGPQAPTSTPVPESSTAGTFPFSFSQPIL